jgi:hypothetical protein
MNNDRASRRLPAIGAALFFTLALLAAARPSAQQPAQSATQAAPPQAVPAPVPSHATGPAVPKDVAGISTTPQGGLVFQGTGQPPTLEAYRPPNWTLAQVRGNPRGTENGIALDFGKPDFTGTLVFGLVPFHDTKYPQPVYRTSVPITAGKAEINIKTSITDRYDMVGWQKSGTGVVGYRVISQTGGMVYDGRVRFKGFGPFEIDVTMIEGPFVGNVEPRRAVISFLLSQPAPCAVVAGERTYACKDGDVRQEITVDKLQPATDYAYKVRYGANEETYGFRTAPLPGARKPFVFAYASDSRGGQGGGERNFNGPNAYIIRRLMAVSASRGAAFMQFTGDLVSGYVTSPDQLTYELANWKRAIEPQAHWMPVYTGLGNHEAILREFSGAGARTVRIGRFPYDTESTEAVFARELVNPENGPASEDGSADDPNPSATDFPSYRRNVYWYQYDNAAMVVLNSDYWFAPSVALVPESGGNLHGYLMDQQIAWLERTLSELERNKTIDHVFLTVHTPLFPNGGHVSDAMWYGGNNTPRATVAGKPVAKGIIERRDELLTLIQQHPKVLAVLTGDEHNYNRTKLGAAVPIYPPDWDKPKVALKRPFYQINNGAAGAPYYAQDDTPWSAAVSGFSTQHAICLFIVDGLKVRLETVNPETLEVLDRAVLR